MAACREDEVVGLCWGQVKGLVQIPSSQQFPEPDRGVIPAAPVPPVGSYQSRHGATAATGPGHGRWKERALLPVPVLAGLCCPAGQRAWVRAALALPRPSPSPSCAPQHRGDAGGHCMGLLGGCRMRAWGAALQPSQGDVQGVRGMLPSWSSHARIRPQQFPIPPRPAVLPARPGICRETGSK